LKLIDFSLTDDVSDLVALVRRVRGLIFWSSKERLWTTALYSTRLTSTSTSPSIQIDRYKASRLRERKKCDKKGKKTCFAQAYRQLNVRPVTMFRVSPQQRAWATTFRGEGGIDAGGLYREILSVMCEELQSGVLPLFMNVPNGRENMGANRDKWVPRPTSTKALYLSMFEFLGKLMGLAIRSKDLLPLDLPSIVWKGIIGERVTEADVIAIDRVAFRMIDEIRKQERVCSSPEQFNAQFTDTKFIVIGSDARSVPLIKGGDHISVNWDNRHEYCRLVMEYRKNEFATQCQAIRRGLATVVPYTLLSLFTWQEFEIQVCGYPKMDIDLLKKMTTYDGCSASDPHIQYFWQVLSKRFDDIERAKFLKFVWGRSRLPVKPADFGSSRFKISVLNRPQPDNSMPIAHTCFFAIDLPKFTSVDITYKRLLWAITHCEAIDADHSNAATDVFRNDDSDDDDDDDS